MLRKYQMAEGKVCECAEAMGQVYVYTNPTDEEKKYLIDVLKLDEHTLNSSLDADELSRLEFEPEHVALIFKKPKNYSAQDKYLFRVFSMGMFLFKDKLVLLLPEEIPIFEGKTASKVTSIQKLFLMVLYRTIFHFIEHLKVINMISESLEKKINQAMENKYLLNLFILEKSLVYYLNAINSNSMVIEKIKHNAGKINLDAESLEFLDDIIIENTQCYKQAEIYANILTGLMDARGTIVGNNLNVLMKTLNIITITIMFPTLVVSMFSMNVRFPFNLTNHPFAFWIIVGMSILSVVLFLILWSMKKWNKY